MTMRQRVMLFFKADVIMCCIAILMFLFIPAAANAEESVCRGLKPFNNLDELLYQFYINLDNDCLFKMPVADLEKIWDIKILSEERQAPGERLYEVGDRVDFKGKPYKL